MKRRQEAAEEAERQRLQAEADAKAAAEAQAEAARQAEIARDQADAPGSPTSGKDNEAGKYLHFDILFIYLLTLLSLTINKILYHFKFCVLV